MFSTIRDRIKAVQNDVIHSLQRLTGPDQQLASGEEEPDVHWLAGGRLLSRRQDQWSRLHANAERTISLADDLNLSICAVRDRCQREHAHMTEFHRRLTELPAIADKVHGMVATVAALQTEFSRVELHLVDLEHEAAVSRLEDRKMLERAKLEAYKRTRQQHFDELQVEAAQRHLERATQRERRQRREQVERYATFDQLAHEELEHFRRHQTLDEVRPVPCHRGPQLSLDEVDISRESDAAALDAFLADTELDPDDPARDIETDPEDPARDIETDPEDPARDAMLGPEGGVGVLNSNPLAEETSPGDREVAAASGLGATELTASAEGTHRAAEPSERAPAANGSARAPPDGT
ncbi:dysbindin-like [Pollicipes pollicipes]|uniref:dysbindin-like n=1 Tax=Pollicipes pollicipes TaxID=41117 RepID=UPI001884A90F|nr:dysbindin-like [Pollicipes pollicipes]XP_037078435.1 dysbindin-like [Pollicipes pollicipes]XP_037078436.1 dysbindin-like [Pollicipes pollicipes]XP_037078437.1 dysbindin-like [Pollicipes pollicipes]